MSKQYKIRWTEQDVENLRKTITNFNAKIRRLSKSKPELIGHLPETTNVKELKELIYTRQDLKREINTLKRFSKRGAEELINIPNTDYNIKITKWQKIEMNRRIAIINKRRKTRLEEIQNIEMTSRGKSLGYTRGQLGMGKAEEIALLPMTSFFRTMTNTDIKKRWKSVITQTQTDYFTKRDYQVRDNYIKGIKENYDFENVKDIIEHIENMNIKEFLKIFNEEGGTFEYASPNGKLNIKQAEYKAYESALRTIWLPNK